MNWIFQLFKGKSSVTPWLARTSLYDFIQRHTDPVTGYLNQEAGALPDEAKRSKSEVRFAAGSWDGILTHHVNDNEKQLHAARLANFTIRYSKDPKTESAVEMYRSCTNGNLVSFLDRSIEKIAEATPPKDALLILMREWLLKAPDRGPVKFAIALLGAMEDREFFPYLLVFGVHDEFTLFVAVAAVNMFGEASVQPLFELAKKVKGWGRIHAIERMVHFPLSAEIRRWLITEGFRNDVMYEYSAKDCAVAGDLFGHLKAAQIEDVVFWGAADLIRALLDEGPTIGISGYPHANELIEEFLKHASSRRPELRWYSVLSALESYSELSDLNRKTLAPLLNHPDWAVLAEKGLQADNEDFDHAVAIAQAKGLATFPHHWRRLQKSPSSWVHWFGACEAASENDVSMLLDFALLTLPLPKIATGMGEELGIGPGYEHHQALEALLGRLEKFQEAAEPLVIAALGSPVVRLRWAAVRALAKWGQCSPAMTEALRTVMKQESRDDLKIAEGKLLNGAPLEVN